MSSAGMEFLLNGKSLRVSETAPQATLLDFIRGRGLTGAKEGCAEGECGACAVLFVKQCAAGASYQSVNSCLVPLPAAAGQEIYTVESLAESGRLADVQRAMAELGGSQCGYCTRASSSACSPPSSIPVHATSVAFSTPNPSAAISAAAPAIAPFGTPCNPSAHPPIHRYVGVSASPAPVIGPIDYETPKGRFSRPCDLNAALQLAAQNPAAQFVAGNTDLGVLTNLRHQRFPHLISLDGMPELREFHDDPDAIEIGAGLTLTEIGERWTDAPEVFREWLRLFASPLIRNRATLGGNLATASPIGDAAPLLLSLDTELRVASLTGDRIMPLHSFFRAYRETALHRGEIIRSIRIPKPLPAHVRFYKVAKRRVDDISTVAAAFSTHASSTRLAFGGVGPTPIRAFEAEDDIPHAKEILARTLHPMSDHRGSAAYRLAMAQSLFDKYLAETGA